MESYQSLSDLQPSGNRYADTSIGPCDYSQTEIEFTGRDYLFDRLIAGIADGPEGYESHIEEKLLRAESGDNLLIFFTPEFQQKFLEGLQLYTPPEHNQLLALDINDIKQYSYLPVMAVDSPFYARERARLVYHPLFRYFKLVEGLSYDETHKPHLLNPPIAYVNSDILTGISVMHADENLAEQKRFFPKQKSFEICEEVIIPSAAAGDDGYQSAIYRGRLYSKSVVEIGEQGKTILLPTKNIFSDDR